MGCLLPLASSAQTEDGSRSTDGATLWESLRQLPPRGQDPTTTVEALLRKIRLSDSLSSAFNTLDAANDSTLYEVDEDALIETLRQLAASQIPASGTGKQLSTSELLRYQLLVQLLTQPNARYQLGTGNRQARAQNDAATIEQRLLSTTTFDTLGIARSGIGDSLLLPEWEQNAALTNARLQALEAQQAALLMYLQQRDALTGGATSPSIVPTAPASLHTLALPADFKRSVFFFVGQSTLTPQARATLDEAASFLQRFPTIRFDLQGFASPDGGLQRNLQLGKERMAAVCRYLAQRGIGLERLRAASYGQIDYASQRQIGRRVDISLILP